MGWQVAPTRVFEVLQQVVDSAVRTKHYFSDGFPCYADVYYPNATYQAVRNKAQTYSVEGMNAELRHYLARLHRSTRCYSKSVSALQRALKLFVNAWNQCQLFRRTQPNYPTNLIDFISVGD